LVWKVTRMIISPNPLVSLGELVARIRALFRRTQRSNAHIDAISAGPLFLNLISCRGTLHDQRVNLSPKEFSLLAEQMRQRRAVLNRDILLERGRRYDYAGDTRTMDVRLRWLREKIGADPFQSRYFQTVRGIGYRFENPYDDYDDET